MHYNKDQYLRDLDKYLQICGIEIRKDGQMRCPNSLAHNNNDKSFSAKLYTNENIGHPRVKCFACGFDGDIYDVAGHYNNEKEFKKQFEIINKTFGNVELSPPPQTKKNTEKIDNKANYIALDKKKAKEIFSEENIKKAAKKSPIEIVKNGALKNVWIYNDKNNDIIAIDARFEYNDEKIVLTYWYDGKKIRADKSINIIYNLYESLNSNKPILIHEGAKCAAIANKNFKKIISIAYNRGVENSDKPDWQLYKNKQIFILPDNDSPGFKAALKIKKKLPNAIILKSIYFKFEIDEKDKADIEQLLEPGICTPEELENFIINYDENEQNEFLRNKGPICLGIDDNNFIYFIDRFQRLFETKPEQFNKTKLLRLANLDYWKLNYSTEKGGINFDRAIDDIFDDSSKKEFDFEKVRGRGAWKENGNYIYHDGKTTHGEITNEFMYIRKNKRDIGIFDSPASFNLTKKLKNLCDHISFENQSDIVRLLGWSIISPFCGALFWRPAILMTGESGSGKTTVLEKIVLPLSEALHCNTHSTSEAGIRAKVGNDSCAICFEEAEGSSNHDKSKDNHRNNLFSVMRASSSDNAADGYKSNKEQKSIKYSMKNMFLFVSITPTISDIADSNRMFKVNFVKPEKKKTKYKWETIEKELVELLDKKNCRSIRALTWSLLPKIVEDTKKIIQIIKYGDIFGDKKKSDRLATGESVLISTYLNIIRNFDMSEKNLKEFLIKYYSHVEEEEERDEANELLNLIFDYTFDISIDKDRKTLSIKEALNSIRYSDFSLFDSTELAAEREYIRRLGQFGIKLTKEKYLAIANSNNELKKIINKENGYNKIFKRHKYFIECGKTVKINGSSCRCTIIDIFKDEEIKKRDEQLENLIF